MVDSLTSVDELVRTLGGDRARARRYRARRRFSLARLPRLLAHGLLDVMEERRLELR